MGSLSRERGPPGRGPRSGATLIPLAVVAVLLLPSVSAHLDLAQDGANTLADGSSREGTHLAGNISDLELLDNNSWVLEEEDLGTGLASNNETYLDTGFSNITLGSATGLADAALVDGNYAVLSEADGGTPATSNFSSPNSVTPILGTSSGESSFLTGSGPLQLQEASITTPASFDLHYVDASSTLKGNLTNLSLMGQEAGEGEIIESFTGVQNQSDYGNNASAAIGSVTNFQNLQIEDSSFASFSEGSLTTGATLVNASSWVQDSARPYGSFGGNLSDMGAVDANSGLLQQSNSRYGILFSFTGLPGGVEKSLVLRGKINEVSGTEDCDISWGTTATGSFTAVDSITWKETSWDWHNNTLTGSSSATTIWLQFHDSHNNFGTDFEIDRLALLIGGGSTHQLDTEVQVATNASSSAELEFSFQRLTGDDYTLEIDQGGFWMTRYNITGNGIQTATFTLSSSEINNNNVRIRFRDTILGGDATLSELRILWLRVNSTASSGAADAEVELFVGNTSTHSSYQLELNYSVSDETFLLEVWNQTAGAFESPHTLDQHTLTNLTVPIFADQLQLGVLRLRITSENVSGDLVFDVLTIHHLRLRGTSLGGEVHQAAVDLDYSGIPQDAADYAIRIRYAVTDEPLEVRLFQNATWQILGQVGETAETTEWLHVYGTPGSSMTLRLRGVNDGPAPDTVNSSWTIHEVEVVSNYSASVSFGFEGVLRISGIPDDQVQSLNLSFFVDDESFSLEVFDFALSLWSPLTDLTATSATNLVWELSSTQVDAGEVMVRFLAAAVPDAVPSNLSIDWLRLDGYTPPVDYRLSWQLDFSGVAGGDLQVRGWGAVDEPLALRIWDGSSWQFVGALQSELTWINVTLLPLWYNGGTLSLLLQDSLPGDFSQSIFSIDQAVIFQNIAPDTPGNLAPATGAQLSVPPLFQWTYSDDDGDSQGAVEIDVDSLGFFTSGDGDDGDIWNPDPISQTELFVPYDWDGNAPLLQPGTTHRWRMRVSDDHGAWSGWSAPQSFSIISESSPLGTLLFSKNSEAVSAGSLRITLTVTGNTLATEPEIAISTPGLTFQPAIPMTAQAGAWVFDFGVGDHDGSEWVDGPNTITISNATTAAGTPLSLQTDPVFVTDTRPPALATGQLPSTWSGTVEVVGTTLDAGTVASVQFRIDDGSWVLASDRALSQAWDNWGLSVDASDIDAGTHTLSVRALDQAGNEALLNSTFEVKAEGVNLGAGFVSALVALVLLLIIAFLVFIVARRRTEPEPITDEPGWTEILGDLTTPTKLERFTEESGAPAEKRRTEIPGHLMILDPEKSMDKFVEGSSNRLAFKAASSLIEQGEKTSYNPLFIYGERGSGKSHLLNAIGLGLEPRVIIKVSGKDLVGDFMEMLSSGQRAQFIPTFSRADVLLVDDIEHISGLDQLQEDFFEIFNVLHEGGSLIVLTSNVPASDLKGVADRLTSRFQMGMEVRLGELETETRGAILSRLARGRGWELPPDVLAYISKEHKGSVTDLEDLLTQLIATAHYGGGKITAEMAAEVLAPEPTATEEPSPRQTAIVPTPMRRAALDRVMIDGGIGYMLESESNDLVDGVMAEILSSRKGLALTRTPLGRFRRRMGAGSSRITSYWLSERRGDDSISPYNLEEMVRNVNNFLREQPDPSVVLFEGLEYLATYNTFDQVIKMIQSIRDHVTMQEGILLIGLAPDVLPLQEYRKLEREFLVVDEETLVEYDLARS